jgi:hypothetical protein
MIIRSARDGRWLRRERSARPVAKAFSLRGSWEVPEKRSFNSPGGNGLGRGSAHLCDAERR